MNSKTEVLSRHSICYGNKIIDFSLLQNQRKTFRIEVSPDMQVLVKAPKNISHEQILHRVNTKAPWIYKQISYFEDFHPRITPRKYIS
jgi:predicted metal-dependent hydrolase